MLVEMAGKFDCKYTIIKLHQSYLLINVLRINYDGIYSCEFDVKLQNFKLKTKENIYETTVTPIKYIGRITIYYIR